MTSNRAELIDPHKSQIDYGAERAKSFLDTHELAKAVVDWVTHNLR